jgi:hypothetical protein
MYAARRRVSEILVSFRVSESKKYFFEGYHQNSTDSFEKIHMHHRVDVVCVCVCDDQSLMSMYR